MNDICWLKYFNVGVSVAVHGWKNEIIELKVQTWAFLCNRGHLRSPENPTVEYESEYQTRYVFGGLSNEWEYFHVHREIRQAKHRT